MSFAPFSPFLSVIILFIMEAFVVRESLSALLSGQSFGLGFCPSVRAMQNFQLRNYSGLWYEVEKYSFFPEVLSSCVRVFYTDNEDETFTVSISHQVRRLNGDGYDEWENAGITRYLSNDGSAQFMLDLIFQQGPVPFVVSYPYIVLHTDYTSYTIKYSCKQIGFHNIQSMWVLSREKTFSPETRRTIYGIITSMGLSTDKLLMSDMTTCPITPMTKSINSSDTNQNQTVQAGSI